MSSFKNIPIRVEQPAPPDGAAVALSLLQEVQGLMEEFVRSGQSGSIDLRQVAYMGPDAYRLLKDSLATGEVSATIKSAVGRTEILETVYSGVWWVTHRNRQEEGVTEQIEVAEVPEILKSQREDIRQGLRRLSKRIAETESESNWAVDETAPVQK